jgi:hypothetical protein
LADEPSRPKNLKEEPVLLAPVIITAPRSAVRGIAADRTIGADAIPGYGAGTIDELVGELASESGEDDPVVIVNGERIDDYGDVSDLPIEAVERVDILPRGAGAAVGASGRGRVINIVLRRQVKTVVAGGGYRAATDGGFSAASGEFTATRIQGPNRLNLALRVRDEDQLLESERGVVQPLRPYPFGVTGTIVPDPGAPTNEIDPVLSAAAGRPVARAAITPTAGPPPLSAFVATAGTADEADLGRFRTLRPESRNYDLSAGAVQRLAPWLTGSLNGRLSLNESASLIGVASSLFLLPQGNRFSPFSRDVAIAAVRRAPLEAQFETLTASVSGGLNATVASWQVSLTASHNRADRSFFNERQDFAQMAAPIVLNDQRFNPFTGGLSDLILVETDESVAVTNSSTVQLSASGSPVKLPAGPLRLTVSGGLGATTLESRNSFGGTSTVRDLSRDERRVSVIASVPLASRRAQFLSGLGELDANFEVGTTDIDGVGALTRVSTGLNWEPVDRIRLSAGWEQARTPAAVESLADPVVITPGVRYFDFLTGETVDVFQTFGGNPSLRPQTLTSGRLAANAAPWSRYNLQLNVEYSSTRTTDLISSLPPASAAVLLAFPDRFVRNAEGVLTSVDVRPVNFDLQSLEQIRYGLSFTVPIGPASAQRGKTPSNGGGSGRPSGAPRPRLQAAANHTVVLSNELVIRPGLPAVDLLDGGAIGIAGGRPRGQVDFSLAFSATGLGARVSGARRSESTLELRQGETVGVLRFDPLLTMNLTGFVEATRLFPRVTALKGSRFTLSVVNLSNARQRVTDPLGETPLNYQPAYRDAVGRTVELSVRRTF